MFTSKKTLSIAKPTVLLLVFIFCFFGIIGLANPSTQSFFKQFSSVNILFSIFSIFVFQKKTTSRFVYFSSFVWIMGFFIECMGTNTGLLFGNYYYGETLGYKIFNTPVIIGGSWLLLTVLNANVIAYLFDKFKTTSSSIKDTVKIQILIKSFLASILMVLLDILIEPVAVKLDFWHWTNGVIPISNYLYWFLFSFIFQLIYFFTNQKEATKELNLFLLLQWLFFGILNIS